MDTIQLKSKKSSEQVETEEKKNDMQPLIIDFKVQVNDLKDKKSAEDIEKSLKKGKDKQFIANTLNNNRVVVPELSTFCDKIFERYNNLNKAKLNKIQPDDRVLQDKDDHQSIIVEDLRKINNLSEFPYQGFKYEDFKKLFTEALDQIESFQNKMLKRQVDWQKKELERTSNDNQEPKPAETTQEKQKGAKAVKKNSSEDKKDREDIKFVVDTSQVVDRLKIMKLLIIIIKFKYKMYNQNNKGSNQMHYKQLLQNSIEVLQDVFIDIKFKILRKTDFSSNANQRQQVINFLCEKEMVERRKNNEEKTNKLKKDTSRNYEKEILMYLIKLSQEIIKEKCPNQYFSFERYDALRDFDDIDISMEAVKTVSLM